jgi:hypothetical protein
MTPPTQLHAVLISSPAATAVAEGYRVHDPIIVHHRRVVAAECRLIEALAKLELIFDRPLGASSRQNAALKSIPISA